MEQQNVPPEVAKRLKGWFITFWGYILFHYAVGIGGVLASTLAAAVNDTVVSKTAGVVAAVCLAVIGFVQPERQYRKFVVAWRLLDGKVNLYKYKLLTLAELLDAMMAAEKTLDQMEQEASIPRPRGQTATNSSGAEPGPEANAGAKQHDRRPS